MKVYRYNQHEDDVPDNPPNEELERRRHRVDNIGGALGVGAGLSGGAYWYNKNRTVAPKKIVPKLVAIVTAGYALGRAGALTYNGMYNARENEKPGFQKKAAIDQNELLQLAKHYPETEQYLLDRQYLLDQGKHYRDKGRVDTILRVKQKRINEMAVPEIKTKTKPVTKIAHYSLPYIFYELT